jgi:hypothetical protein
VTRNVRSVDLEYKISRENVFKTTTCPIHKLILVIFIEEQDMGEIDDEE